MSPARKLSTLVRTASVAGLSAFAINAQAQNQNTAPSTDIITRLNAVEIFSAPYTDNVVLRDTTTRVVASCQSIRPPKGFEQPAAFKAFKDLQVGMMLWGGGVEKPNAEQTQAASTLIERIHTACGPHPARPAFGSK